MNSSYSDILSRIENALTAAAARFQPVHPGRH